MPDKKDLQLASDLRTVVTRLVKSLRRHSVMAEKLSLTERSTLALLDQHHELLPNELAGMEKITTQSMSAVLAHLFKLGYIHRRTAATDKRKVIISLSDTGRALLYQIRNERDEWLYKTLRAACSAEEIGLLQQAILPLTKLVDFK